MAAPSVFEFRVKELQVFRKLSSDAPHYEHA